MLLVKKKKKKKKRFVVLHADHPAIGPSTYIIMDRKTGVQYLYAVNGYSGGLTPLIDSKGKPLTAAKK